MDAKVKEKEAAQEKRAEETAGGAVLEAEMAEHRPTPEERSVTGKEHRKKVPRSSHAEWSPSPNRPDPVELLSEQDVARQQDLVPVRHGRMRVSPFTFYRGAARVMAADLAPTPVSGLRAQICGDAHLSNFGVFASPERTLVFDVNDFDETLPGPWEWDLKRLVASFAIAGRNNALDRPTRDTVTRRATQAYREAMGQLAESSTLDGWYSKLSAEAVMQTVKQKKQRVGLEKGLEKARLRDSLQAFNKLTEVVDGQVRIVTQPPSVVRLQDLGEAAGISQERLAEVAHKSLENYRATLPDDRRVLLDRFQLVDVARKVVGVGSVGTFCLIALFVGRDAGDPLFLQIKEATSSVLEEFLPKSRYKHHGQRVVEGQRLMQATSDIFLGWMRGAGDDRRHFYCRQLRDGKASAVIEEMGHPQLLWYAGLCGWTLARAHARSGDAIAIASYVGRSDTLDRSLAEFAELYADQNELDHQAFEQAIADGKIEAVDGV
jgi:uncharacterized protein (DUF2252 family)